jgi:hypothetical protein
MSRRPDPARIEAARRDAHRNRLIGEGELPDRADALIAAWDAEAARRGLTLGPDYWHGAWEWMAARRRSGG